MPKKPTPPANSNSIDTIRANIARAAIRASERHGQADRIARSIYDRCDYAEAAAAIPRLSELADDAKAFADECTQFVAQLDTIAQRDEFDGLRAAVHMAEANRYMADAGYAASTCTDIVKLIASDLPTF